MAWLLFSAWAGPAIASQGAVFVLDVAPHEEADRAGVRAGDQLVSWSVADGGTTAMAGNGRFETPLDVHLLLLEHGGRVPVTLGVERDGIALELVLEPGTWGLEARPDLEPLGLARLTSEWNRLRSGDEEARAALRSLGSLADSWRDGAPADALWLDLLVAQAAAELRLPEQAESAATAARGLAQALHDPVREALAWERLGRALERASRFEDSSSAFRKSLDLLQGALPGSLTLARAYEHVGRLAWWQDRLDEAEALDQEALAIRGRISPDGLPVADSYNDLGLIAWNRGDLDACEGYHRGALAIRERLAPRGLRTAYSLVNLGIVTWRRGSLSEAERYYRRAIEIYEVLRPDSIELGRAMLNLGIVYQDRGYFVEAEVYYRRAIELQQRWGTERDVAHVLTNLGNLQYELGDAGLAARTLRRSLEIKQRLGLRVDSVTTLQALSHLGTDVEERRHDLELARQILEEDAPESYQLGLVLRDLARVAREQGRRDEADGIVESALELVQRIAPGSILVAQLLEERADADLAAGHADAAETRLRTALELTRSAIPGSTEEADARFRLSRALRALGHTDEALDLLSSAEDTVENVFAEGGGTIEERARARATWSRLYVEQIGLLVESGRPGEAFEVSERYRARGLLELLATRDLQLREVPPELDRRRQIAETQYRRLVAERRELPGPPDAEQRAELDAARAELHEIRKAIGGLAPRFAGLAEVPTLNLEGVRKALPPGTALLSYVVGAERSWVFALDASSPRPQAHEIAIGRAELARRVRELRDELNAPSLRSSWRVRAAALGELLLGPVADRVVAAERVLLLPDGPLHFVPFAALPVSGPGGGALLVELRPVSYGTSVTVLAELDARPTSARPPELVVFADPDTANDPLRPGEIRLAARARERRFEPLTESRHEAERIRALFPGRSLVWLGGAATETRVKSLDQSVSNLHFACHAVVDPKAPLDSGLVLSTPSAGSREDGILQAWEIFEQLRIDADLVVLSACDTALGEELPGEGVLGLVRAFQFAGARSVVATQWKVDDPAAAELSGELYGRLRDGTDAAEALRRAQLAMLRRTPTAHPYHWAAFQLFGVGAQSAGAPLAPESAPGTPVTTTP